MKGSVMPMSILPRDHDRNCLRTRINLMEVRGRRAVQARSSAGTVCGGAGSGAGGHVGGEDVVGVAVEVLAGPVVAHGGAGVGVAGGDLDVAQVDAGVEHGGDEGVAQHVRVHPRQPDPGLVGEGVQASGGGVPVHPGAASGAQDRPGRRVPGWRGRWPGRPRAAAG